MISKSIKEWAEDFGVDKNSLISKMRERSHEIDIDEESLVGRDEIESLLKDANIGKGVIEKRISATVIRRRRKKTEPLKKAVEEEEAGPVREEMPHVEPDKVVKEEIPIKGELKSTVEPGVKKEIVEPKVEEVSPKVIREVEITPSQRPGRKKVYGKKEDVLKRKEILREREKLAKIRLKKKKESPEAEAKPAKKTIKMSEVISVAELAKRMGIKANEVIKALMGLGMVATINQYIDIDAATLVAGEFGFEVEGTTLQVSDLIGEVEDKPEDLKPRSPVVTVMGHVDHGKTSLLDAIRKTNVTKGEKGGITQHIGAYNVHLDKGDITFLDTPGHEAFTAMRARGASITDIVVLVVAANDGVMPQTVEAINHAKAASVPIIVAINKIDLPDANPDRVRNELSEYGLVPEEWGGDTIFVEVSAKKNIGIVELLEYILLQSEVLELKANPNKPARGTIIESKLDKGRGPVATVLIQDGTLKLGDIFVTGIHSGKVRAMISDWGERIKSAGPSIPVEVVGLTGVPDAGDPFNVVKDEAVAKKIAEMRLAKDREKELARTSKVSLDDLYDKIKRGDVKELNIIVKGDVQGSVGAVVDALNKLEHEDVKIQVIHSNVGGVSENDVMLAAASNAIIIGFNVRAEAKAKELAEKEGVDIKFYSVIYDLVDDVKKAIEGLLEPTFMEEVVGTAEVREVFNIPKVGAIAGCYVNKGKILRGSNVRLIRDSVVVYEGKVSSLRRFKEDVKEVASGFECGIGIERYNDIKVGDVIEAYVLEKIERRLS